VHGASPAAVFTQRAIQPRDTPVTQRRARTRDDPLRGETVITRGPGAAMFHPK
jgi:hypothetical protein